VASCGKGGGVDGPLDDGGVGVTSPRAEGGGRCSDDGGGGRRDGGVDGRICGRSPAARLADGRLVCVEPELSGGRLDSLDGLGATDERPGDGATDDRASDGATDERPGAGATDERTGDGATDERLCAGAADGRLACGELGAGGGLDGGAGRLGDVDERDGGGGCGRTD
jgi:hypothetical protein